MDTHSSAKASKVEASLKSESSRPILHSYWRSSCSWRVRIALNLKNIEFEYAGVNLLNNEQTLSSFSTMNPNRRVPTLKIDGHVLNQSGAILEYLDETRPSPALLPGDYFLRAQIRNVCDIIGCDIQPVQNLAVLKRVCT